MNEYKPEPIETNEIILPKDLADLTEKIAANTHDVWAKARMEEGWTYGCKRDDELKTNPCLVPYYELSESEKDYDRKTSVETIKLILKLGYKIIKE